MTNFPNSNLPKPRNWQAPNFDLVAKPLWLSVSEASKLSGIAPKTVRRALEKKQLKFKSP